MHNQELTDEIAHRVAIGMRHLTIAELMGEYARLGYVLDRTMDAHCTARYMTGERAGAAYPCTTAGLRERDTGRTAWNIESRRDENFRRMQALRNEVFAVTPRGSILEV